MGGIGVKRRTIIHNTPCRVYVYRNAQIMNILNENLLVVLKWWIFLISILALPTKLVRYLEHGLGVIYSSWFKYMFIAYHTGYISRHNSQVQYSSTQYAACLKRFE